MGKRGVVLLLGIYFAAPSLFAANKVETIQGIILQECKKKASYDAALAMIRPLYLTCVPGTKVTVQLAAKGKEDGSCRLNCLKPNSGVVIGR